jgi:hypothetical protein
MRKSNITKLSKALEKIGGSPFSIADVCKKTGVSDPTVRSFLKSCDVQEVSYGQYQLIKTPTQTTNKTITNLIETKSYEKTNLEENMSTKTAEANPIDTTNSANKSQNTSISNQPKSEVFGEIYLNAYLKGFDRGFELGLEKAQSLNAK